MTREMKAKGRMDAHNCRWVSDLLAVDSRNVWLHPEREDTVQKWYTWLRDKQNRDFEKRREEQPE